MGKKTAYYVQCKMKREVQPRIHQTLMSWIPESRAEKGRILRLKNHGEWEDGWEVIETCAKKKAELVEAQERDYLKQREVSDV